MNCLKGIFFFVILYVSALCGEGENTLFLTWKKDPLHTMTVVWLTENPDPQILIQWKTKEETQWRQKAAVRFLQTYSDKKFYILQAELTFLKPDTIYQFKVENESTLHQFKTAPKTLDQPVKFVIGGDAYHDDVVTLKEMMRVVAAFKPLFCAVGGDIAYAFEKKESPKERIERWFTFLKAWETTMVTEEGLMIPLIPALGSHDIKGAYLAGTSNAKFFFSVFPFPGILGYGALDFSRWMSLLVLDSGHAVPIKGAQTQWLKKALDDRRDFDYLFALYHNGAYPSVRPFNGKNAEEVRKNWVPLFETYRLTAAFENHDHTLKRTHLITNNFLDPKGILYLGDGSFGVKYPRKPLSDLWYLAFSDSVQAVWGVELNQEKAKFFALSNNNKILDRTEKSSRNRLEELSRN